MNGGRCPGQKKMMGRGPDGGCGTQERLCPPTSRNSASKFPASQAGILPTAKKKSSLDVDFFSQARKALSERSPFDVPEDGSGSTTSGVLSSVSTLPSGLASLLKQSDSRKRHKKSHSSADKKSSRASDRSKGGNIWVETEDYFRDLALPDIDALFDICSSLRSFAGIKHFFIPHLENEKKDSGDSSNDLNNNVTLNCENGNAQVNVVEDNNVNSGGIMNGDEVSVNDEVKQEDEHLMQIDNTGTHNDSDKCLPQEEGKLCTISDVSSGLEWLLGCRSRITLTSERPSKKRKLLGRDAGLEKVLIGCPCEGNSSICDFCCKGEMDNGSNRLIVCSSCKVAIHINCYGVQRDVDEPWLCSWCSHRSDVDDSAKYPCVLCPKQGGALKPVDVGSNDSVVQFAHLFCSLWMPEIHVDDTRKMEPLSNLQEIQETRRKLVCNVCKVKCGACVRCSHGTCRAAFHPICAREGKHRMEVWGNYGSENVELRAFCSKHSESPGGISNSQLARISDSSIPNRMTEFSDTQHNLKIGRNGDKTSIHLETSDTISDRSADSESREIGLSDSRQDDVLISECADGDLGSNIGMFERSDNDDATFSDSLNLALILKKLIDRGKVNMKEVASEIGMSPDSLLSTLSEDSLVPDLQCKIVKWLRNHAYLSTLHKNLKVKLKPSVLSKSEMAETDHSDGVIVSESGISDPVAVKSVPPRRRTKSNIRILTDDKVICSSEEFVSDSGVIDEVKADELAREQPENSSELSVNVEKASIKCDDGLQDRSATDLSKSEGGSCNPSGCILSEKIDVEHTAVTEQGDSISPDQATAIYSDKNLVPTDLIKMNECSNSYIHPYIHKELLHSRSGLHLKENICGFEGFRVGETSHLEASSNTSICCDHQKIYSNCNAISESDEAIPEKLVTAKKLGVYDLSPADEVEGEIIYFQHKLLSNAIARKHFTDNLICKVAKSLPKEIDVARAQKWDAVLVNQYLNDIREAKKQGRKERRHKEAQAVLAAATAAAAASSRISSFRKDSYDESSHHEKMKISNGRAGVSSQPIPRPKETLSRIAVSRNSSEKFSDVHSVSDLSKEHPRSCDICRRTETILNPILVCSSCKVAVHLDCYRSVKESTGPWCCELCEELLSSKCSAAASLNFWEKPYFVAECGLCGGTTGAFRKSTDGRWVHAFCAEWVFEPTFRRGQVNPVEGMETISKGIDICCICRRKHGICIKCSYGHCQTTFHPSCARSTGFYMNVKTINGKMQRKAYCERHGLEQKAKAETQKHGVEELKSMKQVRVELERLRLLCERIIKREKIKRDLVLCSHSILACKRDHVARSVLVHSPFFPPEVSSESATTSLKGNTDGYKSCSDEIQRSDDVTVDSTISVKRRIKVTMDTDQKTDDSSTSQNLFTRKPLERISFSGKQIPHRVVLASRNPLDDGEWSSNSRKRFETFERELVMTSDQASMKNQQLPKGYFYIPVDCLPKEKQIDQDTHSGEALEQNR